jgi:hypothetical protein
MDNGELMDHQTNKTSDWVDIDQPFQNIDGQYLGPIMRYGYDDMPMYGRDTCYLKQKTIPVHTLISVLGYAAGNYGPYYGKLSSTKEERLDKKRKRKARKKAQQRNRR